MVKEVNDVNTYWRSEVKGRLVEARITLIGDTELAVETALCCSAMGFNKITLLGSRKNGITNKIVYAERSCDDTVSQMTAKFMKKINPDSSATSYIVDVERDYTAYLRAQPRPDILVDLSNSDHSRYCSSKWAGETGVDYIAAAVQGRRGDAISSSDPGKEMKERAKEYIELVGKIDDRQDPVLAALMGAFVSDDIFNMYLSRQGIADYVTDKTGNAIRMWDIPAPKFTIDFSDYESDVKDGSFVVGGVGNVGSQATRLLAAKGAKQLMIFDRGKVKARNLSSTMQPGRQWLFYGQSNVGLPKVDVLKDRLAPYDVEIVARNKSFDGEADVGRYDAYISAFDKFIPRAWMQLLATKHGKPLTDGGIASPQMCECVVYAPGKSGCLEHTLSGRLKVGAVLKELQETEETRHVWDTGGCEGIMHAGAVTKGLALAALHVELIGRAMKGSKLQEIYVSLAEPDRLIISDAVESCNCSYSSLLYRWLKVL